MTYYGGKELAASFRTVRENTIKIAEDVPESKYDFTPAPDCRSIGKTLVHIALGPKEHEMHHRAQLMTMQRMIGQVPHLTRQMQERMAHMAAQQPAQR